MVDYSKWKDIEISDDEDDTHPNIDTPSLFKWRHEARIERQKEFDAKKAEREKALKEVEAKEKELKDKVSKEKKDSNDLTEIKSSLEAIENEKKEKLKALEAVKKEEKLRPWNVDTISSSGFSKTLINKKDPAKEENLTEEEKENKMRDFVTKYKSEMDKYGMFQKFDDSKNFLNEHKHLACEETANYLVIQCINYAMEKKFSLMDHIAHQVIAMQYLLELAKQLNIDPRACISSFFSKIQIADEEYKKAFYDELKAFKIRIRNRAEEKIKEQIEEMRANGELEEEEPAPLGPGGLDPSEVFQSLPESMQKCFEDKDIGMLQRIIQELPDEEARYHMKRCIDSGLWVPAQDDPNTDPEDGFKRKSAE